MNGVFAEFQDLLRTDPPRFNASPKGLVLSKDEPWWADFINRASEHARTHTSGVIREENLIMVHPYYQVLRTDIPSSRSKEAKTLEETLRKIYPQKYGRILFESYPHYGLRTHEWVDEGLIDKVVFTYNGRGVPLQLDELKEFSNSRTNYICGVYGRACVTTASFAVMYYAPLLSIRPVRDAIVPGDFSLHPAVVLGAINSAPSGVKSHDLNK